MTDVSLTGGGFALRAEFEAQLEALGVRLQDSERDLVLALCVEEYRKDVERVRATGDAR